MKKIFIAPAFAVALLTASIASAQALYSVQESGDIFGDIVRNNQADSSAILNSPFNMGFVNTPTSPMMNGVFHAYNQASPSSPNYQPDLLVGYEFNSNSESVSEIFINFTTGVFFGLINPEAVTMKAIDYIPCIEAKIPKGTYTFQATATPTSGASSAVTFMFETCTAGIWTT